MIRASCLLSTSASCWLLQKSIAHRHVMRAAASKKLEFIGIEDITKRKPVVLAAVAQSNPSPVANQDVLLENQEIRENQNSPQTLTPAKLTNHYSSLAKFRLTGLVVCSAVTGYAMAPLPTDFSTLGLCLLGTALTSASANTYL